MSAVRTTTVATLLALSLISPTALAASPYQTSAEPAAKPAAKAKPVDAARPAPRPATPSPKALPPDIAGECAWVGKRVISLLARDDVEQAARFQAFYRDFGCRDSHLGPTFRCVILGDEVSDAATAATPGQQPGEDTFTARVDRCWSRT